MTKQLYEEALADVKKLKEVAEDNAKKALIEAVAPRIRDLIENQLMREHGDDVSDDLLLDDGLGFEEEDAEPSMASAAASLSGGMEEPESMSVPNIASAISLPDEEGKVTLDLDALAVQPSGDEEFEISNESIKLLNPLVDKLRTANAVQLESKLFQLGAKLEKFSKAGRAVKRTPGFVKAISEMVSEVENTYEYLQESAGLSNKVAYEEKLEGLYKEFNKLAEQNDMKNKKSLFEGDVTLKLTGMPDDINLDDIGVDLITGEEEEDGEEGGEESGDELDLGGDEDSEGGEEEGGDEDLDLDLGGEDEEEETEEEGVDKMESRKLSDNMIVEIDEGMLRREIARMRSLREEAKPASWGNGPGEVSDEFADDDMGDPFLDIDLTTESDDMDEQDDQDKQDMDEQDDQDDQDDQDEQGMDELDQKADRTNSSPAGKKRREEYAQADNQKDYVESQDMDEQDDQDKQDMDELDQMYQDDDMGKQDEQQQAQKQQETLRRRINAERRLQLEAKKKAQGAKKAQKEAQQKAKQKQQEAQQKAKQKKQQEAQKAKQEAQKQAKQAKKMQEAYAYYATKFNESVRRTGKLQSMLAEASNRTGARLNGTSTRSTGDTDNLRKKLAETNLFNAKLLFTNKLLQNESLTKRQKAEVIERLDEARSEREVKLVYESLVKTLAGSSRPLAENAQRRVLGSSSQATRPASTTLTEGFEADRWARLAGLK
jgi:hypothetical protein